MKWCNVILFISSCNSDGRRDILNLNRHGEL